MYFEKYVSGHGERLCGSGVVPVQSLVWPCRRYMAEKRTFSPSLLVVAAPKE